EKHLHVFNVLDQNELLKYLLEILICHHLIENPLSPAVLFTERRTKVDKLASLMCSENFPHYLFVPKGKRLLGKCLPSLNLHQTKQILGYFMQYLYIVCKNNISLDDIYSQISYAIDTQKFTDLVQIAEQFVKLYSRQSNQIYKIIFTNKFGLTYLLKFVSKSELINQDDFDNEVKAIWASFINMFLNGLGQIEDDKSSYKWSIYEMCPLNFNSVLNNFAINIDLWKKNDAKLKQLFNQMTDDS
ncbi:PAT1 -like protein, partial [Brachionus plicatilis]